MSPMTDAFLEGGKDSITPAFLKNNIPVFWGCDDKFFPHVLAVVASIMEHASHKNNYDFLILHSGLAKDDSMQALHWLKRYPNASLRFVDISAMIASHDGDTYRTTERFSIAIYYRLFAPEIFHEYDKIVYIDADVILLKDIADLYHTDLDGCILAANEDLDRIWLSRHDEKVQRYWRDVLGFESGTPYFCSGMLVMNLSAMRQTRSIDALVAVMKHNTFELPDMDTMNVVFRGKIKPVEREWTCMQHPKEIMRTWPKERQDLFNYAHDAIKMIHYAGKKPWEWCYSGTWAGYYWQYATATPFFQKVWGTLKNECRYRKCVYLYLKWSVQLFSNALRLKLSNKKGREKYEGRIRSLQALRGSTFRHMMNVARNRYCIGRS